ncbi:hypothetical protein AK812_SmicGene32968 [Symbiodinium microadriaticum]|uniref:Uncharacterized protein n=1 Tax=Symbiodinium microadriaticum TaxID=2951 RepID=A0A1Q9CSW4_SYMMI|nr:hypothetical protein AK812_SmicGene32968 [Symbiodinium microadriaticum]CAE7794035.1 unnamed protein product [Symbiodinium microadriaticum]
MGCGASHKYEVSTLSGIEEDKPKQQGLSENSRSLGRDYHPEGNVDGDKPAKYRPDPDMDGVEVTSVEGDGELAKAVAAANDDKLLMKYAQSSAEGKRRSGSARRVFAPSNGPLSGEPLQISRGSPEAEAGELVLANNRVGGLRLQHHLADRESPGHLKGAGMAHEANEMSRPLARAY